jgi:hypothetical protein
LASSAFSIADTVQVQEGYWKHRIVRIGPDKAYEELALLIAGSPPERQHIAAHAFGAALYDVEGEQGLSTCDARFSYGCYHEFLGRAIASLGLGVVGRLNQGCIDSLKESPLSCQHGIGHGVLAAIGYDEASLRKALAICEDLPYNDPIGGCYGGVFMEYNMRTMLGDRASLRPLQDGEPLYPCDVLGSEYLPACYFGLPQWWLLTWEQAHGTEAPGTPSTGALCDKAGSSALVRTCYEGMGTMVALEAGFDPEKAKELCRLSSRDEKRQLYCRSYAATSITLSTPTMDGNGTAVCDGLVGADQAYCLSYATNKANLAFPLDDIQGI